MSRPSRMRAPQARHNRVPGVSAYGTLPVPLPQRLWVAVGPRAEALHLLGQLCANGLVLAVNALWSSCTHWLSQRARK